MNFWQFCSDSPFLVFFIVATVVWAVAGVIKAIWGKPEKHTGDE